jgi:general secretion pathway protein D
MHVNELDVRQLLELLSRRSGLNILVSPKVSGTITANFEGTTVEAVLNAVIKLANLTEKTEGPIHYLYTKGEIDDDAEFAKRERILTRVYKLNYVRSDELLTMIRPFLSEEVGRKRVSVTPSYKFGIGESATFVSGGAGAASAGGGGASSSNTGGPTNQGASGGGSTQGGFQPPTGGNSMSDSDLLIIQDYESNLKIVDQIIERIDKRPFQVLIEAVIISVDLERTRQLGVNFGLVDNLGTALGTIGSGASLNSNVGFNPTQLLTTAGQIAGSTSDPTGFTSAAGGAKFGFVSNNVTGFIQALETIGSTKILASPRILVLNKQRAEIQLGSRLGFQTFSQNFTSTIQQVQFLNTGTLLRIRPFISEDGMVRMELHPERSSGSVTNNIPNQQTAELTTNVMVPDGATLVIGGLMEDEDDYSIQGLPGLARLPLLGYLFGFRQKTEGRRELVVLLTPHIWSAEQVMTHGPAPIMGGHTLDATKWAGLASTDGTPPTQPGAGPAAAGSSPAVSVVARAEPEIALAAGDPRTRSTQTPLAAAPLAAQAGAAAPASGTNVKGGPQDAPPPKRGFFRSLFDRRARRSDAENSERAKPAAASSDPSQTADPSSSSKNAAIAAPAPTTPPAPAPVARAPIRQTQPDEMVGQASFLAASPSIAPSGSTLVREAQTESRAVAPSRGSAESRPGGVLVGPRRHTVEDGETFASIAQRYYGSPRLARALWWFNRGNIRQPDRLAAGDLLIVPDAGQLDTTPDGHEIQSSNNFRTRTSAPEAGANLSSNARPRPVSRSGPAANVRGVSDTAEVRSPRDPSDGGWVPAYKPRPAPGSGWVPASQSRPVGDATPGSNRSGGRAADQPSAFSPNRTDRMTVANADPVSSIPSDSRGQMPSIAGRRNPPFHLVRAHETLRSIARDRLGDSRRAGEIAELNADRIATAGTLEPGQKLILPLDARSVRQSN